MPILDEKYRIHRNEDNAPVDDGFVLRVRKDPAGWLAAWNYANITQNKELSRAMRAWLAENAPSEDTLGTEGRINQSLLAEIRKIVEMIRARR